MRLSGFSPADESIYRFTPPSDTSWDPLNIQRCSQLTTYRIAFWIPLCGWWGCATFIDIYRLEGARPLVGSLEGIYCTMKNLLFLFLLISFGCGTNTQTENQQTNKPEQLTEQPELPEPEKSIANEPTEKTKESKLLEYAEFVFTDEPDGSQQTLEVTWLTNDSIEWKIFAESMLCTYEEYGTAALKQGAEVDEDENGVSYLTSEYEVVDAGKLVSIRIPEPERDKAKIIYIYDQPRDECDPFDELMRKTPSNNR